MNIIILRLKIKTNVFSVIKNINDDESIVCLYLFWNDSNMVYCEHCYRPPRKDYSFSGKNKFLDLIKHYRSCHNYKLHVMCRCCGERIGDYSKDNVEETKDLIKKHAHVCSEIVYILNAVTDDSDVVYLKKLYRYINVDYTKRRTESSDKLPFEHYFLKKEIGEDYLRYEINIILLCFNYKNKCFHSFFIKNYNIIFIFSTLIIELLKILLSLSTVLNEVIFFFIIYPTPNNINISSNI